MPLLRHTCLMILLFAAPAGAKEMVNASGLPLPRFVSLRSDEANVRSGPGTRYPIQWVYHKEGWPVEITEEFDQWRKIRDVEGATGWLHKSVLAGERTALIKTKTPHMLRKDHEADAKPVAKLEPMVMVKLRECMEKWCEVQVQTRRGWVEKTALWGVYPGEVFK